ncbi:hypothetical protein HDV63DRAFT_172136 [Trichoderma sp. SZMC 28014]
MEEESPRWCHAATPVGFWAQRMVTRGHMQVVGQKAHPSPPSAICTRCDAMRYAYGWRPLGRHRYQYLLTAAVMAGQNIQMQVEVPNHPSLGLRCLPVQYTPWRLVMRATLLCCVAHTGPCMECIPPHMPLKRGAYEHVRIRYEVRVRTVAFAPYIGNPAAFLLSLGPTYNIQTLLVCTVSFKAGDAKSQTMRVY